jgi:branched-chain amino acid transport system substrate-binding protein
MAYLPFKLPMLNFYFRSTATVAFIFFSCLFISHASSQEQNEAPMRFGAIAVLSGEGSSWGVNLQRGVMLAVEEVNADGGINGRKVEVLFEDSPNGIGRNAVTAYSKLVSLNGIRFIFGPISMDELLAIAPLAQRDGVFLGGATYMPNASRNFFSTWIDADIETDTMAKYIIGKHRKVAILGSQQSWESQVAHRFRETFTTLGGNVVAFEEPSFEATDVKSEVLKTKLKQPDAIFITSYLLLSKYTKEIRALEIRAPLFSIELDKTVTDSTNGGAEGMVFIAPSAPSDGFIKKFNERWQTSPDIPAANAYDSAKLLFKAVAQSGYNVEHVIRYFDNFKSYEGATGYIERRNGKTVINTSLYVVKDGRIERLS